MAAGPVSRREKSKENLKILFFRNGIIPTGKQGVTSQNSKSRKSQTFGGAEFTNGLNGIARTSGKEPASRRCFGGDFRLVKSNQTNKKIAQVRSPPPKKSKIEQDFGGLKMFFHNRPNHKTFHKRSFSPCDEDDIETGLNIGKQLSIRIFNNAPCAVSSNGLTDFFTGRNTKSDLT